MKKLIFVLTLICTVAALTLTGCITDIQDNATVVEQPIESVEQASPVDYFPEKVSVEYATGFTVEYYPNYKVVTVLTPWEYAEETFQYILVQENTEPPSGYDDALFITVPVKSAVSMSTSFLPFFDLYGLLDKLVAIDDATYVNNETVLQMTEAGLPSIGTGAAVDVEMLLNLNPDVVFTNGYGFAEYDTHPILQTAGIPVVIDGDYMDTTPLGRAEWGKFIAVFFNEEAKANQIFEQTETDYLKLKSLTANATDKPTVFLNTPWEGVWYMPGGHSFMANFIADAGGDYLWAEDNSTGTLYLGFEDVIAKGCPEADIWLNPGGFSFSAQDVIALDERFENFSAVQNNGLWNNNQVLSANMGNDFYESGVAFPERILADLIYIFHPETMLAAYPDFSTTYYQQLP